jgi:1-acyl-sn-glycerol-3-phosphate acyltransferase
LNTIKKGFSLRDSIAGAILGRIFALWALIVFVVSMLVIVIPVALTNGMEEPAGTEKFRRFGKAWIHSFLFFSGCRIKPKGLGSFMPKENYIVIVNHNSLIDIPISTQNHS